MLVGAVGRKSDVLLSVTDIAWTVDDVTIVVGMVMRLLLDVDAFELRVDADGEILARGEYIDFRG